MIEPEALLEFIEDLIYQEDGKHLSELQRTILLASFQGSRITYEQLAEQCGYSVSYVRQDIAPKLWHQLSALLNEKVSKTTVKSLVEREIRQRTQTAKLRGSQAVPDVSLGQQPQLSQDSTSPDPAAFPNPSGQGVQPQGSTEPLVGQEPTALPSDATAPAWGLSEASSAAAVELTPSLTLADINLGKSNILLVDDHPKNLKVLSDLLEEQGYTVQQAISGAIALQVIPLAPPDLILLDIQMPEMDGYTVCQQLKANPDTRGIPVIFVSAMDQAWDKVKAFSVGGVDYITKPFKLVEVLARVENQLKLQALQHQLRQQNIQLQQAIRELQRLAALDPITQVASRHRFADYAEMLWQEGMMSQLAISLIMVTITGLERFSETYGSRAAEQALRKTAQSFSQLAERSQDLFCRYSGFTFAMVLPDMEQPQAQAIAHQMQQTFDALTLVPDGSANGLTLDLKMGTATIIPTDGNTVDQLIKQCESVG